MKEIIKRSLPESTWRNLQNQKENLRQLYSKIRNLLNRPNIYNMSTKERMGMIFNVDTHMSIDERFLLYSIIRGLQPINVLEIGVLKGATAAIISAAMEDNGQGRIVGIDPYPDITYPEKLFFERFKMVEMASPEGIKKASEIAGASFDMVHFDSIVAHDPMELDISGCLPYLSDPAYLLINNSVHYGVNQAIQEVVDSNENLYDCGFLNTSARTFMKDLAHGTLRLLRFSSNRVADAQALINIAYEKEGKTTPSYDPELINHDPYYCRNVSACPRCRRIQKENSN